MSAFAAAWGLFCVAAFLHNRPIPFGTVRMPPLPVPGALGFHLLVHAALNLGRIALF